MRLVRQSQPYTDADRVKAFSALLRHAGDARKAVVDIRADGIDVTADTLIEWRDKTHSALYVTLAEEQGRAHEEMIAANLRTNALRATLLERELLDKIAEELPHAKIGDASKAMDAIVKSRSTGVDRVLSLTGRPVNGQSSDPQAIEKELLRLGVLKRRAPQVVEGSAEDVTGDEA